MILGVAFIVSPLFPSLNKRMVDDADPVPSRPVPQPSGSSSIPKSPMPSTLRMSHQVLRKKPKDFESELLDRLLNSNPPPAPAAGLLSRSLLGSDSMGIRILHKPDCNRLDM